MKYQHIRHATGIIHYSGIEILLDPMLSPKEYNPPIKKSWNDLRNPRVELPFNLENFKSPDHCLVTHLHQDHFDEYAKNHLPNDINLICQSENQKNFEDMGFNNLLPISHSLDIEGISINRVPGQHGTCVIAKLMGVSSGYILNAPGEPTLYITGDTIFYDEVKSTLEKYKPEVIIAFGGMAQFSHGDPITLSPNDILEIHKIVPQAKIICTHMDSINHCRTSKSSLKDFLISNFDKSNELDAFVIPEDGQMVEL